METKSNKPILIVFEGIDKSGKTTLISEFNKSNDFEYVVLDRFIISSMVYDIVFKRGKYDELYNFFQILSEHLRIVVVYCYAKPDEIRYRMYKTRELLPDELLKINNIEYLFRQTIIDLHRKCNFETINLDTSENNIIECIDIIKEKLSAIQRVK